MESNNPTGSQKEKNGKDSSKTVLTVYEEPRYKGNMKEFDEGCKDVTKFLPEGASSIVVSKDTGTWQVFTELNFYGATVDLMPGRKYEYPNDMSLEKPVKSFRKAP